MPWPLQSECDTYYGNPRGTGGNADPAWERDNIVRLQPPFRMTYADQPVGTIRIHKKCFASLDRVLRAINDAAKGDPAKLLLWGATIYGGAYNFRLKRGQTTLSMHAYGAAIDLDPEHNEFHNLNPRFTADSPVVKAFKAEGWIWGGDWSGASKDGMHFQAARVRP